MILEAIYQRLALTNRQRPQDSLNGLLRIDSFGSIDKTQVFSTKGVVYLIVQYP